MKPRIRNGSYTSSSVAGSSPTTTARVPSPTGPPWYLTISASSNRRSISSSPRSSTSSMRSASRVTGSEITPSALMSA